VLLRLLRLRAGDRHEADERERSDRACARKPKRRHDPILRACSEAR
jgi:hypothetical protein